MTRHLSGKRVRAKASRTRSEHKTQTRPSVSAASAKILRGERSGALLAAIVDSSDDAIISKNLDGIITSWNKSAERLFGYSSAEAIGQNITIIIPEERRGEEGTILQRLRRGERVDHFETIRIAKNGEPLHISLSISPIRNARGRIIGASKVARDITERRRVEEALRRSEEKYRALAESLDAEVRIRTAELEQSNVDILRQADELRDLSRRLLVAQDDERRRVARELHDSAGQTVAALGMQLDRLIPECRRRDPDFAKTVEDCRALAEQLNQEIRTTSYLLHPPMLDEIGLVASLSWYSEGFAERSGIDTHLDVPASLDRFPRDLELVVFRLVQECLTNIHRHSGSRSADIRLTLDNAAVSLEISDHGKGIPLKRLAELQARGSGVGIRGMRERVRQFQGRMHIASDGSGTKFLFVIPLAEAQQAAEASRGIAV